MFWVEGVQCSTKVQSYTGSPTYPGVIGDKECTNEVAPHSADDVKSGSPQPPHSLLNMTEDEEGEDDREEEVN